MLTWYTAAPSQSGLLDVTLQPAEPLEHKGIEHERAIRTLRGRSNRVQLGVPQTRDVLSAWPMTEQLEAENRRRRQSLRFLLRAAGLQSAPGSWLRVYMAAARPESGAAWAGGRTGALGGRSLPTRDRPRADVLTILRRDRRAQVGVRRGVGRRQAGRRRAAVRAGVDGRGVVDLVTELVVCRAVSPWCAGHQGTISACEETQGHSGARTLFPQRRSADAFRPRATPTGSQFIDDRRVVPDCPVKR